MNSEHNTDGATEMTMEPYILQACILIRGQRHICIENLIVLQGCEMYTHVTYLYLS